MIGGAAVASYCISTARMLADFSPLRVAGVLFGGSSAQSRPMTSGTVKLPTGAPGDAGRLPVALAHSVRNYVSPKEVTRSAF